MNLPPNHFSFEAKCRDSLRAGFGDRGYDLTEIFPDRTTRHRHNNGLEEEIWILRRYLFTLAKKNILEYPLSLANCESPDFSGDQQGQSYGIEITEATAPRDQREMTLQERSGQASLLGTFDGRYPHGASGGPNSPSHTPERDLTADILAAIIKKRKKIRKHYKPTSKIDLVIYANSNANMLTYSDTSILIIQNKVLQWHPYIFFDTRINNVAIIKDKKLIIFNKYGITETFSLHDNI